MSVLRIQGWLSTLGAVCGLHPPIMICPRHLRLRFKFVIQPGPTSAFMLSPCVWSIGTVFRVACARPAVEWCTYSHAAAKFVCAYNKCGSSSSINVAEGLLHAWSSFQSIHGSAPFGCCCHRHWYRDTESNSTRLIAVSTGTDRSC